MDVAKIGKIDLFSQIIFHKLWHLLTYISARTDGSWKIGIYCWPRGIAPGLRKRARPRSRQADSTHHGGTGRNNRSPHPVDISRFTNRWCCCHKIIDFIDIDTPVSYQQILPHFLIGHFEIIRYILSAANTSLLLPHFVEEQDGAAERAGAHIRISIKWQYGEAFCDFQYCSYKTRHFGNFQIFNLETV